MAIFQDTNVEITSIGQRYLGGALGTPAFEIDVLKEKVTEWVTEVEELTRIGRTQPHAAYAAFTHGIIGRWTYAIRVFAMSADEVLKPLEQAITQHFIPALTTQQSPSEVTRDLLARPARLGGLGPVNPVH